MDRTLLASQLRAEAAKLSQAADLLEDKTTPLIPRKAKHTVSSSGMNKRSEAQRARWDKVKQKQKQK